MTNVVYLRPFERENLAETAAPARRRGVPCPKSSAPACTGQTRKSFPTNRLCGWKKPLHGDAVRRVRK